MKKDRIGLVFGGKSGEYEVSQMSSASVYRNIDREKHDVVLIGITKQGDFRKVEATPEEMENGTWVEKSEPLNLSELPKMIDFALPIIHGPYCEDGKLQGFFELLDIPYGGCGVLASSLAMDKLAARDVFIKHGLPMCKHVALSKYEYDQDKEASYDMIEKELGYPVFVKPANLGSSVGITKAHDRKELKTAVDFAFKFDRRLCIEESIDCREVEVAVMGNEVPEAAAVGEILSHAEFYDYEAKYTDGATDLSIPAKLPKETYEELRKLAIKAYSAIDCEGFSRCDFFIDKKTGNILLNEINTIPGFTKFSMFPLLWQEAGRPYKDTIERIIELGYERYNTKNNR